MTFSLFCKLYPLPGIGSAIFAVFFCLSWTSFPLFVQSPAEISCMLDRMPSKPLSQTAWLYGCLLRCPGSLPVCDVSQSKGENQEADGGSRSIARLPCCAVNRGNNTVDMETAHIVCHERNDGLCMHW